MRARNVSSRHFDKYHRYVDGDDGPQNAQVARINAVEAWIAGAAAIFGLADLRHKSLLFCLFSPHTFCQPIPNVRPQRRRKVKLGGRDRETCFVAAIVGEHDRSFEERKRDAKLHPLIGPYVVGLGEANPFLAKRTSCIDAGVDSMNRNSGVLRVTVYESPVCGMLSAVHWRDAGVVVEKWCRNVLQKSWLYLPRSVDCDDVWFDFVEKCYAVFCID